MLKGDEDGTAARIAALEAAHVILTEGLELLTSQNKLLQQQLRDALKRVG